MNFSILELSKLSWHFNISTLIRWNAKIISKYQNCQNTKISKSLKQNFNWHISASCDPILIINSLLDSPLKGQSSVHNFVILRLICSEIIPKIFLIYIGIILEYLDVRDMKLPDMKLLTLDSPLWGESNKL